MDMNRGSDKRLSGPGDGIRQSALRASVSAGGIRVSAIAAHLSLRVSDRVGRRPIMSLDPTEARSSHSLGLLASTIDQIVIRCHRWGPSLRAERSRPHIGAMNLGLSDEETAALAQELHDIVENDHYPFSPRIRALRAILAKLRPEPAPSPCRRRR